MKHIEIEEAFKIAKFNNAIRLQNRIMELCEAIKCDLSEIEEPLSEETEEEDDDDDDFVDENSTVKEELFALLEVYRTIIES